jgi:hypothetical protein
MSCYQRIDSQYKNTQHDYKNYDTQHERHSVYFVIILSVFNAECCAFSCHADCRYAECHYVECRGTLLPTV